MLSKKFIKKILKEEVGQPGLYDKLGRSALLYYHKQKKVHYEKEYGEDIPPFDEWIDSLKRDYPKYGDFGHSVQVTAKNSPILEGLDTQVKIKVLSDYILNHNEGGDKHRVEVINKNDLPSHVEQSLTDLNCTDSYFELVWDNILQDKRSRWNEGIKERMWLEIKDEVIEKMEDDDYQEENGIDFDSIEREEDYFKTYWHYPIQNLGWDKMELCDWYTFYTDKTEVAEHIIRNTDDYGSKLWAMFPLEEHQWFIIKSELFN